MKLIRSCLLLLVMMLINSVCVAYEQDTHRSLSLTTVEQSVLAAQNNNTLSDFGLNTDISEFSQQKFPNSAGESKSIIELVQDGADFEDKFPRSIHHFYDPIDNQSLQHPLLNFFGGANSSPDWALEDTGDINGQDNSYKNATDAFYKALTSFTKTERDQQWGTLFESLGNVIHHIQDMAQPEHVRNDLHCGIFWGCGLPGAIIGVYDPSLFEDHSLTVFEDGIPSTLVNYPSVTFPTAREFWTTRASDSIVTNRRGLADFTNRNFISKDTNFEIKGGVPAASSRYNLPVPGGTNFVDLATLEGDGAGICQRLNLSGPIDLPPNSPCQIEFIENVVTDSYDPTQSGTNTRAASLSFFDQYLSEYNVNNVLVEDGDAFHVMDVDRLITINEYNVDAAHQFLIPRAAAYGAGLIDHFFKTKLSAYGSSGQLIVTNLNSFSLDGNFELWSEDGQGNRQMAIAWQRQLAPGQNFTEQYNGGIVLNGTTGYVVFNGMSSQDANVPTVGAKKVQLGFYSSKPEVTWPIWSPIENIEEQKTWGNSKKVTRIYYLQHDKVILKERTEEIQILPSVSRGSSGTYNETITYTLVLGNQDKEWLPATQPIGLLGNTVSLPDSVNVRATNDSCGTGTGYFPLWAPGPSWFGGYNYVSAYFPDYYTPPTVYVGYPGDPFICQLISQQTDKTLYSIP